MADWEIKNYREEVIDVKQLAKALKVTEQHLYRELRRTDCEIPHHTIGKAKRFLLSEVLEATKNKKEHK